MAKAKNIKHYIDEVFKDYERAIKTAVKDAGREARDDILWRAKECVYEYYDNYEPSIYDRTDTLVKSIKPLLKEGYRGGGTTYVIQAGVWYDPAELAGQYHGSEKWENVDPAWVIENYLQGIHPTTDGGTTYIPVSDPVSPSAKMDTYLETYQKTMSQKVIKSLINQIRKGVK